MKPVINSYIDEMRSTACARPHLRPVNHSPLKLESNTVTKLPRETNLERQRRKRIQMLRLLRECLQRG